MTPSKATRSWNASRDATASCPVIASSTSSTLSASPRRGPRELVHQRLVDVEPARRVDDDDVLALRARLLEPLARGRDGVLRSPR